MADDVNNKVSKVMLSKLKKSNTQEDSKNYKKINDKKTGKKTLSAASSKKWAQPIITISLCLFALSAIMGSILFGFHSGSGNYPQPNSSDDISAEFTANQIVHSISTKKSSLLFGRIAALGDGYAVLELSSGNTLPIKLTDKTVFDPPKEISPGKFASIEVNKVGGKYSALKIIGADLGIIDPVRTDGH